MITAYDGATDLDDIVTAGSWRIQNTNPNIPTGFDWGQLLVIHGTQDTVAQMIFDYTNSAVAVRTGNPSQVGGTGAWRDWAKIWTDKNHGSGSGLDADLLDGHDSSYYRDAETLDGYDSLYFRNVASSLANDDPNIASHPFMVSDHANTPDSNYSWHIMTMYWDEAEPYSIRAQIAVKYGQSVPEMYTRNCFNNIWNAWVRCDNNGTATSSTQFLSDHWSIKEIGGVLYFAYDNVKKAKLDSSGNLTTVGDIIAFGTV